MKIGSRSLRRGGFADETAEKENDILPQTVHYF